MRPVPLRPAAADTHTLQPVASVQPQPYLDTEQAAAHLKRSPRTLEKQRVIGGGPRFYKFGRNVRYTIADLDAWASQHSYESTSDPEYAEHHSADRRAG